MKTHNNDDKRREIIENLKEIVELLNLTNPDYNVHRLKHYINAIGRLEILKQSITKNITKKELGKILGIAGYNESSIIGSIIDFLKNGEMKKLNELRKKEGEGTKEPKEPKEPKILEEFKLIYGIGKKSAEEFYKAGYHNLADLEEDKKNLLNHAQKGGVLWKDDISQKIPRVEVEKIGKIILSLLKSMKIHAVIAGSFRRGKSSSGDIDILLRKEENQEINLKEIVKKLGKYVVYDLTHINPIDVWRGIFKLDESGVARRLDLKIIPKKSWAAGLLHATGSDFFNKSIIRPYLKKLDYSLSEYSLKNLKTEEDLFFDSEEDFFEYIGLEYIPPEKREMGVALIPKELKGYYIKKTDDEIQDFYIQIDADKIFLNKQNFRAINSPLIQAFFSDYPEATCCKLVGYDFMIVQNILMLILYQKEIIPPNEQLARFKIEDFLDKELYEFYNKLTGEKPQIGEFFYRLVDFEDIQKHPIKYFEWFYHNQNEDTSLDASLAMFLNGISYATLTKILLHKKFTDSKIIRNKNISVDKKLFFRRDAEDPELIFSLKICGDILIDFLKKNGNEYISILPLEKIYFELADHKKFYLPGFSQSFELEQIYATAVSATEEEQFLITPKEIILYWKSNDYTKENYGNITLKDLSGEEIEYHIAMGLLFILSSNFYPTMFNMEDLSELERYLNILGIEEPSYRKLIPENNYEYDLWNNYIKKHDLRS